ncbi:peroxisomal bifunctional enzyme [Thecamonas trahens ATCC 50062]|uniref:Peroxisomal bifunctional enzyme n=1 Tax=Thecamonas trahens ATCC 50062 TaxID=461836 RepID=A0A0L0DB96_THETB|nr:peroxisomal bifunctional enzyme [Thecamonas trahens ATCC 50062]KNC49386.1 peroxisomal bifunctional enzyme [Thecamonas trahens ATCC 50062]|eukprot:XP_013757811.1 peroxisomal bifunctional enzyme [Thecamonas trahens ATCC 50062]
MSHIFPWPTLRTAEPSSAVGYQLLATGPEQTVAVVSLHSPPVNALSHALRKGIAAGLDAAVADGAAALVIVAEGKTFPAGADISEFATGKAMAKPVLTDLIADLDAPDLPLLTLAAMHGTAFGGGLELALATHYRIALPGTLLGLPEVGLGLLPGAGGTQRLPRLLGLVDAAKAITTGRPIKADKALKAGLLDAVVSPPPPPGTPLTAALANTAVAYAVDILAAHAAAGTSPAATRRVSALPVPGGASKAMIEAIKAKTVAASRGFEAPGVIIDAIAGVLEPTFDEGLAVEANAFVQLFTSTQARALQAFFFAERAASKVPGVNPRDAVALRKLGIVGAGTMGSGIALAALKAKRPLAVVLLDVSRDSLDAAADRIVAYLDSRVAKGRMTRAAADDALARITYATDYSSLADADMVIEAVFEKLALKKKIFASLDAVCKADAILASNTSTLNIDAIAAATSRPHAVVGTHFFAPAHVMPLLENIRGAASGSAALASSMALGKILGKKAIMVGNCPGFLANRIFANYFNESALLVEEGVPYDAVDAAARAFGLPMGPFQTADLSGLDIGASIRKEKVYAAIHGARTSSLPDKLVDAGRYGQKTGAGWYKYDGRKAVVDPYVTRLVTEHIAALPSSTAAGAPPLDSDDAIVLRLLLPVVLEGLRCLEEGIALRASDIDVAAVYGYGWPRYRCGPMWWAENELGWDDVLDACNDMQPLWAGQPYLRPPALLTLLAEEDMTLREWAKANTSKL